MLVTDLPNLSMIDYPRGGELRIEVAAAKTYVEMYPGSAAKINALLNAGAGVAAGSVVISGPTGTNLIKASDNTSLGVTGQIRIASGAITGVAVPGTVALVSTASTLPTSDGGSVTFTVANNVVTSVVYTGPGA